jgi:hypothetical protein
MNINHLIGMLIIIAFCLLGYTHFENFTNEVSYTKSSLDDKEYLSSKVGSIDINSFI